MAILKKKSNGEFAVDNGKKKAATTGKYLIVSKGGKLSLRAIRATNGAAKKKKAAAPKKRLTKSVKKKTTKAKCKNVKQSVFAFI